MSPEVDGAALIIVLRQSFDKWMFVAPEAEMPKVFCRFPVRLSNFLPVNCVLDGQFTVLEERDRLAMSESDRVGLSAALGVLQSVLSAGLENDWLHIHRLAKARKVRGGFSESPDSEEAKWWNDRLLMIASDAAKLPLVETKTGRLPASSDSDVDTIADFVLPSYSVATDDRVSSEKVWELASETMVLDPPIQSRSVEWNDLSGGWYELGVPVVLRGLKEIAAHIRPEDAKLESIPVASDKRGWIARYLEVVGQLPSNYDRTELVDNLIPNQLGELCAVASLLRDREIPESLKLLAESIGCPVKGRLVDNQLAQITGALESANQALLSVVPGELSEDELLEEIVVHLGKQFGDGESVDDEKYPLLVLSAQLLGYLWDAKGMGAASLVQRFPFLMRDRSVSRHTPKKMMSPVVSWPDDAQSFADIYPPARVIADIYADPANGLADVPKALIEWGITYEQPLFRERRAIVGAELLTELCDGPSVQAGLTVRNEQFSQVALFGTEVIQRCEQDKELATLLFGFVLSYLAPADPSWRQTRTVIGRKDGKEIPLTIRDTLWLGELKSRAWVPIKGGKNNERVTPTRVSLSTLFYDRWLKNNDAAVQFLADCFEFDILDLRLEALGPELKPEVSSRLAAFVQMGRDDLPFYDGLILAEEERRKREEEKDRNRKFGLVVQDAIQRILTQYGLRIEVIDRGYDFDVEIAEDVPLMEAGTHELAVGPLRVEVKATTSNQVRLTPAQARVASTDDKFVLCVVDLREFSVAAAQSLGDDDVAERIWMVKGLRESVNETHSLIFEATNQEVAVQNEAKLRYAVPAEMWESGASIGDWVQSLASSVLPPTSE